MELQDVWGKAVTYKGKCLSLNCARLCAARLALYVFCCRNMAEERVRTADAMYRS